MREIYNEGRVIGLSQYELYVRQLLSREPEATPMTESEWLANTVSESSSMILCVTKGTSSGVHDYPLPEHSQLCGASVLYATLFQGQVTLAEGSNWAIRVDDYGELISNTDELHPVTPGEPADVPTKEDPQAMPEWLGKRCDNYIKIKSALMVQPGEWSENEDVVASQSLNPDFAKTGFIRLMIQEALTEDVYLLIHGFADKGLVEGGIEILQSGKSYRPQDGDFLGPSMFPWACPIYLMVSIDAYDALVRDLRLWENRVLFLGTLHTIPYGVQMLTQQDEELVTEDSQNLLADAFGTVAQMWQQDGEYDLNYYVQTLTEHSVPLTDQLQEDLLSPKLGTVDEMVEEGGIL